jgi:hypothetical protein
MSWNISGLEAGGAVTTAMQFGRLPEHTRYNCIVTDITAGVSEVVFAVRYEDWFGNHYRVTGTRVGGMPSDGKPDEWRGHQGTIGQPDWLTCES